MKHWLDIAIVAGTKNLDGRLVLDVEPAFHSCIHEGLELWVVPPSIDIPRHLTISAFQFHSKDSFIVTFSEISDVEIADQLVGKRCLIDRDDARGVEVTVASAQDNGPMVIGYAIIDANEGPVGKVERVMDRAMQPLLVVVGDEANEILIPFVEEYIVDIDDDSMTITMDLPQGLLEL